MRKKALSLNDRRGYAHLVTSRAAPNAEQERGVLAILRAKAPRRALSPAEAVRIAEWQATTLLELAGLGEPPTPAELISELPRVLVRSDVDLPISGCTSWTAGRWLILLNGAEPLVRQRFSLAHEFKHVIDHRFYGELYVGRPGLSAPAQAEQAADYFAACLLMPRNWLHQAWADGHQRVSDLARLFAVSAPAMARRLEHLGIADRGREQDAGESATYARLKHPWMRSTA